ncbi:hypothetical protein SSX86_027786 [Deinandra increscens subsp. villosa]|uniref:F-box domain-containing protein n=1 Tax=Deinandra increscens subsp. villosa TaxID=3103831 RepID=A0AAP0C7G8_9ASTR
MELIQGTHKEPKFAPEDYISNMPDNVITHILNRLPIQEAVRTGTLSRNWRFKWNMLSQLVFDDDFFEYLSTRESDENHGRIIRRLLLHFEGAITKFVLYLEMECYDIAPVILFLSRKGVKDLTIIQKIGQALELPNQFFSFSELKHLNLHHCCFNLPASFHGFPNLLSLELYFVKFESGKFSQLFTQCPVLENLNIRFTVHAHVKLAEIAKLTNLKVLTLFMRNIDDSVLTSSSIISELVGFLPKLQELELDFRVCKSFTEDGARKRSPTTFPCLKTLKLSEIDLGNGIMLSFAFELIKCFPNLQSLEITARDWSCNEDGARKRSPTTFPCLKTLKLSNLSIYLCGGMMSSFAPIIIRSSSSLQTLEILADDWPFIEDGATFPCLNTLKISDMDLGNVDRLSSAFEMIRSSPSLQTLEITSVHWVVVLPDTTYSRESINVDGTRKRSPTTFPCLSLRTLKLSHIDLGRNIVLSFAFEIIMNSPNLQTLEIATRDRGVKCPPAIVSPELDYNAMRLLQLRSVVFTDLIGSENEVCLIKYLLACSPFLKEIRIHLHKRLASNENFLFASKLLKLHRASPVAEIVICC